ncbi:MAG: TonB-dependent receptor [Sphingomicrobium sp.]
MVSIVIQPTSAFAAREPPEASKGTSAQGKQEKPTSKAAVPETIVVTAARSNLPATSLPLNYQIIGGSDLRRDVAVYGSIIDAVSARIPSFSPTREKLSGFGETLRGRSPLYEIDGVPQSTPIRDGSRDAYTIDPFFVEKVEVILGSNALQGIGATGGVVNQVTVESPGIDGLAVRSLVQGTANRMRTSTEGGKLAGSIAWRHGKFDALVGAAFEGRGAFVDARGRLIGQDGTEGEIQDSRSRSEFARAGFQLGRSGRLELVANQFRLAGNGDYVTIPGSRQGGIPTSATRGNRMGLPPSGKARLLSMSYKNSGLLGGSLSAQLFLNRTIDLFGGGVFATFQDAHIDPTGKLFDQSENVSKKTGAKFSFERGLPGLEQLKLIAGLDMLVDRTAQTLKLTNRKWVPATTFRSIAPFGQANLELAGGLLRIIGGVRLENVRLDVPDYTTLAFYGSRNVTGGTPAFHRLLKNGGIIFEPATGVRAFASYSEGYTIPDVGRILRAVTQPNVMIDHFLDLRPIVSDNRELGLEWNRGTLDASASYFWSSSRLGSVLVRNSDGIFDVVRQPIRLRGFEARVSWRAPLPGLRLAGALATLVGRTDANGDGRLNEDLDGANIGPDRLNLSAEWKHGLFWVRGTMRRYFPRHFHGQDPRNDFAGYSLLDAEAGYELGRAQLSVSVSNLTNRQYITYFSDTQGPTDDLRFFAGRGRTITVGLSQNW